ncbi:Transcription factor PCF2 (fragment) [Bradyrhizobium sp. STM 3809]
MSTMNQQTWQSGGGHGAVAIARAAIAGPTRQSTLSPMDESQRSGEAHARVRNHPPRNRNRGAQGLGHVR